MGVSFVLRHILFYMNERLAEIAAKRKKNLYFALKRFEFFDSVLDVEEIPVQLKQ